MRNLKALRQRLSISQKDFAASLGIAKTTYHGYETGAREPRSDFWINVATTYGVTIDYLMGLTDNPQGASTKQDTDYDLSADALEIACAYSELDQFGKDMIRLVLLGERRRVNAKES